MDNAPILLWALVGALKLYGVRYANARPGNPAQSTILLPIGRPSSAFRFDTSVRVYSDTPLIPIAYRYNQVSGTLPSGRSGGCVSEPVSIRILLAYGTFVRLFS